MQQAVAFHLERIADLVIRGTQVPPTKTDAKPSIDKKTGILAC
jgi:hypothetical protein